MRIIVLQYYIRKTIIKREYSSDEEEIAYPITMSKLTTDGVSKRLSYTHSAMLYQEKFDTWLNLQPLIEITQIAGTLEKWPNTPIYKGNVQLIGYRSLDGLRSAKVLPSRIAKCKVSPLLPALIMRDILMDRCGTNHKTRSETAKMLKLAGEAASGSIDIQVSHMLSSVEILGKRWAEESSDVYRTKLMNLPQGVILANVIYEEMLSVMNTHKFLSGLARKDSAYRDHEVVYVKSALSKIIVTADLFIWNYDQVDFILHRSGFLELFNKVAEMQSAMLYAWMQNGTSMPNSHYIDCVRFWKHISLVVTSFYDPLNPHSIKKENRGFVYLKSIEGLGVSELIRRGDDRWNWTNERLGQVLWKALHDDQVVMEHLFRRSDFYQILNTLSEETLAEVLGTVKLMGHPSIEVEEGLDSLYEKTHADLPINQTTRNSCIGILTRDVVRVFYNKYKRYPNVEFDPGVHPNLKHLFETSRPWNSNEAQALISTLTPANWFFVRFAKNDEFEDMDNRLALLKDKALGLQRSKVLQNWISEVRTTKNIIDSKAILHFLFSPEDLISLSDYMTQFGEDEWSDTLYDYLVIKLTAKELELKPKGRFFGASPSVERDRRIVTESNAMRFLDNVVPDQLLTPNELDVLKKLVSFRDYRAIYPNCHIINISFDFSSWNNSMRSEVVDVGAGRILDSWYGTNYYSKTMKAYENMLIYYDDGIIKRKWDGQYGGIEGLNQATWSIVFIGGIKYALESLGHKYSITVKGDDVRAAIIVPKSSVPLNQLDMFRDQIMTSIQGLCKDMGWSLNPNESFVSLSLIATSKQYLFNDTWLPASLKKIMKILSHTNGVFVSLEDIISTIFSIAHSSCSQTTVVMPSFATASLTAATVFYRQLSSNQRTKQNIMALLMWPQILSGPGPLPLQTFFVRGENDMLSVIIALYRYIMVHSDDYYLKGIIQNIISIPISKEKNGKMILGDPYCIDLESPDRPESVLKRELRRILTRRVVQPDIKMLLSVRSANIADLLIACLLSSNPYYAKVVTAIWEATPFYLIEELLAKFTHSSTVMGFFTQMRSLNSLSRLGTRMWRRIVVAANKRAIFWSNTLMPRYEPLTKFWGCEIPGWESLCPTEIATRVRNNQWGDVRGLTYPSLTTQNIIMSEEHIRTCLFSYGYLPRGAYSTLKIFHNDCTFQTLDASHHYASHKSAKLWLGAKTSSKTEYVDIPESTQSPVLRKLKSLLALRKSAKTLGPTIVPIIDKLIQSYTSVPMSELELLTPINSVEHFAHRVPINSFSMTTMPNARPNIAQLCLVNNESFNVLKEDTTNRSINMAARQFFIIACATFPLQYKQRLSKEHPTSFLATLHHDIKNTKMYQLCPHCCANVDDEPITFPNLSYLDLSDYQKLPLVACGKFETHAIMTAINNLKLGTRLVMTAPKIDEIDNSAKLLQCLRLIVSNHIQISLDTFHTIGREGIHHSQATSSLVDNVLIAEGKKTLNAALASLNIWRCVDSKTLYEGLLAEAYIIFLTRGVSSFQFDGSGNSDGYVPDICSTVMTIVFERIAQVQGLAFVNEGLRECQYVARDIVWGFYLDDIQAMSKSFYLAHWQLFKHWFTEPRFCPYQYTMSLHNTDVSLAQSLDSRFSYIMTLFFSTLRKDRRLAWSKLNEWMSLRPQDRPQYYLHAVLSRDIQYVVTRSYITEYLIYKPWRSEEAMRASLFSDEEIISLFDSEVDPDVEELESYIDQLRNLGDDDIPYHVTNTITWSHLKAKTLNINNEQHPSLKPLFKACFDALPRDLTDIIAECEERIYHFRQAYSIIVNLKVIQGSLVECERVIKENKNRVFNNIRDGPIVMRLPSHQRVGAPVDIEDIPLVSLLCKKAHASGMTHTIVQQIFPTEPNASYSLLMEQSIDWEILISRGRQELFTDGVDFYRIFGNLNKAYLRWVEVMEYAKVSWSQHLRKSVVVMLGDGGGSVSRHILTTYSDVRIVFCDKISPSGPGSLVNSNEAPVEFLSNTNVDLTSKLEWGGFVTGDIQDNSTRENILTRLEGTSRPCRLVISDIVPDNLRISHIEFMKILYGIVDTGFNALSRGGILIIRIPLLMNVRWAHALAVLSVSFSHIHFAISNFDRPELLSIYATIFISHDTAHYAADMSRRFFNPDYKPPITVWMSTMLGKIINKLVELKIKVFDLPIHERFITLTHSWDHIVRILPIAPLTSLTMDWTMDFSLKSKHLCTLVTEYVNNCGFVMVHRERWLRETVRTRNTSRSLKDISYHFKELLIARVLNISLTRFKIGNTMTMSEIITTTQREFADIKDLMYHIRSMYAQQGYFGSRYYREITLVRNVLKHHMRFMSWWLMSYHVRRIAHEPDHKWYDNSVDITLCESCHVVAQGGYAPLDWKPPFTNQIADFLWY